MVGISALGSRKPHLLAGGALLMRLAWCGAASAQNAPAISSASQDAPGSTTSTTAIISPPPSTAPHLDLQQPVFGAGTGTGGIYDLNVSSAQGGPPGTIAVTSAAPPSPAYSFEQYARQIHGSVSTGFSSNGGHVFSGEVNLPLVPGIADVDVGAATGQTGGYKAFNGSKIASVGYDAYSVGLHLHPSDNFDAYFGVTGLRLNAPPPQW
jgi:hypothetical protein